MRTIARALALAALLATLLYPAPHASASGTTLFGMTRGDGSLIAGANAWQGKTMAIQNAYLGISLGAPIIFAGTLDDIWADGSVPMISFGVPFHPKDAALYRSWIDAVGREVKGFLDGPDNVLNNADDRIAYMRLAWEANCCMAWSPCDTSPTKWVPAVTAANYKFMWHEFHWRWRNSVGIPNTRLQWIFNANQSDTCAAGKMENLYPGNDEVDWVGIDGYTWIQADAPADVFGTSTDATKMLKRLRDVAPGKPLGINEVGVDPDANMGKGPWIAAYFDYLQANDVRMSVWFNNNKERDWMIFGGPAGNETYAFGGTTYNAWSQYRTGVANTWVIGADALNPQRLTDAQFRGL